jgi:hypothetical protein
VKLPNLTTMNRRQAFHTLTRAADQFFPAAVVGFARIPLGNRNSGEFHYGKSLSAARLALLTALLLAPLELHCEAAADYTTAAEVPLTYQLRRDGNVSLAIYDSHGRMVRELLRGEKQGAGEHTVSWEGLDRDGHAMPPGAYEWRLLRTPGFQAEYLLSFGSNPTSAPYHMWVGNHAGPTSVHVDAEGNLYAASYSAENAPALLRQSLDGTRRDWETYAPKIIEGRWEGGMALATDGRGTLYMLQNNGLVQVIDARSGELMVERVGNRAWAGGILNRAKRKWDPLPDGHGSGADIAARGDTVVVCSRDRGDVRWLKLDDGSLEHTVAVPAPRSLDLAPDGTVYVVTEDKILAVPRDGAPRTVMEGLVNPGRLAYDEANNQLLVAHGAPRPNQVSRYDLSGKLVNTYGKGGGRRFGPYEPGDFFNIIDLTADRQGGFVVVESGHETFRRTARFDVDGKRLAEWHGGQKWGSFVAFDPDDSSRVMFNGGEEVKALAVADCKARTYHVTHLLRAPDTDGLMPSLTGHGALWHLRRVDGELYLVNPGGNVASSAPAVYRADLESGLAVPVARSGNVNTSQIWDFKKNRMSATMPGFWRDGMKRLGAEIDKKLALSGELSGYSWSDDNGNGTVDLDELFLAAGLRYSALFIDADWNLLLAGSLDNSEAPFVHIVPNRHAGGMPPRWVWTDARPTAHRSPVEWPQLGRSVSQAVYRGADSSLYVFAKGHANPADDRQGETWPACTSGAARLMKWNADGELMWNVGRHASVNESLPGQFHDPMQVLGEARGNIVVQDRVIRIAQVFTSDGLYAGDFFDRHLDDGFPSEIYTAAPRAYQPGLLLHDNIAGVMHITPDGEVLWNPSGRAGAPVYRIYGWDDWERQRGELTLAEAVPSADRNGTGLRAEYFQSPQQQGPVALTRTDTHLWFGNRTLAATRDTSGRPWLDKASLSAFDTAQFSARWSGEVEAPFSEEFRFVIESEQGSVVRLWLDGEPLIDEPAAAPTPRSARARSGDGRTVRVLSKPVRFEAGRRYALKIEYSGGGPTPQMHFEWESFSQERQHVPTAFLYRGQDK